MRRLYGDANMAYTEETEDHPSEHGHLVVADDGTVHFQTTADLRKERGVDPPEEEVGAAVEPTGPPPEGERAQNEEVGTPEAPAAG